jgi:hypothetical protein
MWICNALAGAMGSVGLHTSIVPYVTGEASATWTNFNTIGINSINMIKSGNVWGGRLGLGLMHPFGERLFLTGEIGGGSYGSQKQIGTNASGNPATYNRFSIDGYDVLVGTLMVVQSIELFGHAGFMIENFRNNRWEDLAQAIPGGFLSGSVSQHTNATQVFPEIKVGANYMLPFIAFNGQLALTASYVHVFGANPRISENTFASQAGIIQNSYVSSQNPTLNSVLFGLRYYI